MRQIDAGLASYSRWERGKNTPQGRNLQQLIEVLDLDPTEAIAAAGGVPAPGAEAKRALDTASDLAAEVERLAARVAELEAQDRASEDRIAAIVDAIVAARLAELAATEGTPEPRDARPQAHDATSA